MEWCCVVVCVCVCGRRQSKIGWELHEAFGGPGKIIVRPPPSRCQIIDGKRISMYVGR